MSMPMLCAPEFCTPANSGGSCYRNMEISTNADTSTLSTKSEIDPDIEEEAKKIKAANEKKMVQIRNLPVVGHTSQRSDTVTPQENLTEDWTSIQGHFGWEEISHVLIPYLTRSDQKYVCMRIVKTKLFHKYRQIFNNELWDCFRLDIVGATKAEADLLDEINVHHSDGLFGPMQFSVNEFLISLDDVKEMYDFLEFSYLRLVEKSSSEHKKCGYIRIAGQNCVPYVLSDATQYVPLFYFEGECKYLEERAVELRGWNLAYIKLLCKMQGIRKPLFDNDSIRVVEMELVKKFFPPDTRFDCTWLTPSNAESLMAPKTVPAEANKPNNQDRPATKRPADNQNTNPPKIMPGKRTVPEARFLTKPPPQYPGTQQQNVSNVFQIRDFPCNVSPGNTCPYFLVKNSLHGKTLFGLNMEPYAMTVILIPLEELATSFFKMSLDTVANAIAVMRLDIYLPNKLQIRLLQRCNRHPTVGLIKFTDVVKHILMIGHLLSSARTRI